MSALPLRRSQVQITGRADKVGHYQDDDDDI
eukprot:COSAG02_NODE_3959_length_5983_cov_9.304176_9_plen_31_part_00